MKVFRVDCDVDNFQAFHLAEDPDYLNNPYECADLPPKAANWVPPDVYADPPLGKRGDFFEFWSCCAFAMAPKAYTVLNDILAPAGELLPLFHEGTEYKVFHILKRFECVDRKRCPDWFRQCQSSEPKLVFKSELLPQVSLFKFKEDPVRYYVIERTGDPKTEFKAAVEHHGLTGLEFVQVWRSRK